MTFRNLFIDHDLTPEVKAWIAQEVAEQEARFAQLATSMEDLAEQRVQWYQEFFDRITTLGFNTDGDDKQKLSLADLPVKPAGRVDRVVWKWGVDGE